ncbi:MAG: hypothetical protein H6Q13_176 [Bacteroidetes bacterium]|nr:hypothetical protein [Bacteroidota bacterium]
MYNEDRRREVLPKRRNPYKQNVYRGFFVLEAGLEPAQLQ